MKENLHYIIVAVLLTIGASILWSLGKINFVLSRKKTGSPRRSPELMQTQIAAIDKEGKIIAVNETWRRLSKDNKFPSNLNVDVNFLHVCANSTGPFEALMQKLGAGVQEVLEGKRGEFVLKYPEPTRKAPAKVMMYATPLSRRTGGAMFGYVPLSNHTLEDLFQVETRTLMRAARLQGESRQLSREELWVLDLFAAGFSRGSIAVMHNRSAKKIDAFLSGIFNKLGIQRHSDLLHLVH